MSGSVCGHAWPCVAACGRVCGHVWPCVAMHGRVWPCMVVRGHAWTPQCSEKASEMKENASERRPQGGQHAPRRHRKSRIWLQEAPEMKVRVSIDFWSHFGGENGGQGGPRAAKGAPKGGPGEAKGRPRGAAKGRPREAKGRPKGGPKEAKGRPREAKGGKEAKPTKEICFLGSFCEPFLEPFQ